MSCRKVIDYGDCYYLVFSLVGDPSGSWVCEKDLLVQGTIEEFERIFAGKIVHRAEKNKKNN